MARQVDDDLYLATGDEESEDYADTEILEEKRPKSPAKKAPRDGEKEISEEGEDFPGEGSGEREEEENY